MKTPKAGLKGKSEEISLQIEQQTKNLENRKERMKTFDGVSRRYK